jgi:molybdopterin-guanine dinucleotide biosynthesis adapter protein
MKVFGFAGYSGSGKTTLIERLIPLFTAEGLRVSLIKHTHHDFDIDRPGKDSHRFREAGADEVLLSGDRRWALMRELRNEAPPDLQTLLAKLSPCDLVLVEGYKFVELPKIEVHRPAAGHSPIHPDNPDIVAIASDVALTASLPCLDLNDPPAIARFVKNYLGLE